MAVNLAESTLRKAGKEPMAKQLAKAAVAGAVKGAKAGALGGVVKGAETGATVGVKRAFKNGNAGVSKQANVPSSKSNTTHNKVLDNSMIAHNKKTAVDKSVYDRDYNLRGYTPARTGEVRVMDRVDNYEKTGNKTTGHVYHGTSKKSK